MYALARQLGDGETTGSVAEGFGQRWELGPTQYQSEEDVRKSSLNLNGWTHIVKAERRLGFTVVDVIALNAAGQVETVFAGEAEVAAREDDAINVITDLSQFIQMLSHENTQLRRELAEALARVNELERGAAVARAESEVMDAGAEAVPGHDTTRLFAHEAEVDVREPYSADTLLQVEPRDVAVRVEEENLGTLQRMVRTSGGDSVSLRPGQYVKGGVTYRHGEAYFFVSHGSQMECLVSDGNLLPFARGRLFGMKS